MTAPLCAPRPPAVGVLLARPTLRDVFETQHEYLYRLLRRLGVPSRDADDLVSDVLLRVNEQLGTFDPERPLRPWLFGFAFRVASEYRRSSHVRAELCDACDREADEGATPEDQMLRRDAHRLVHAAVKALGAEQRTVFVLHEFNELSVKAIAERLEIPLGTAYSRLRLAREAFAVKLRELGRVEPET